MKFSNLTKTVGVAFATPFVPLMAVSCSSDEGFSEKTFDYSDMDWTEVRYFEATVSASGWNDGDTFGFTDMDDSGMQDSNLPELSKVRVAGIDTPEMGETVGEDYRETTGYEREIAEAGAILANSLMPAGTRVRVLTGVPQISYDRILGSVWYGDNFENNWEVEAISRGLAQPGITENDVSLYIGSTWSNLHYLAYPMYHVFNYAKQEGLGFWQYGPNEVFLVRGVSDWSALNKGMSADTKRELGYNF